MKKIANPLASTFYAASGIFFLISATREIYAFSSLIEWGMFIVVCIGIFVSLYIKAFWIAFYYYLLVLFYNPLILGIIDVKETFIADIVVGLTFFFIGLHWKKFISQDY